MKIQLKSYMVIVLTLILGFILGALTHKAAGRFFPLMGQACDPAKFNHASLRGMPGAMLMKRIEFVVQPTEEQRDQLKLIADKYSEILSEKMKIHHDEFREIMRLVEKDLEPVLTPEQLKRFREHLKKRGRKFGRHHGGPFPGNPGGGSKKME